jgi:uncharacterized lipoprotein YmbA
VRSLCVVLCAVLAGACALSRPDHFYALGSENSQVLKARSDFAMQINLHVSLPLMVDRSEMVLNDTSGVIILEHERWAAPLSEQLSTTLGQAIEARRQDVIVASRSVSQPDGPMTTVSVEVVELSLQKTMGVRMEARWRVQRGDNVTQGRENFTSPAPGAGYQRLVRSLNACIGQLADRLVAQLPP